MTPGARPIVSHLVVAALAVGLGFALGSSRDDAPRPPASASGPPTAVTEATSTGTPEPTASAAASAGPPAAPDDLLARAAQGDLAALKALEARDVGGRTPAEAIALEAGHAALAREEAQRLVDDVARGPVLLDDPGVAAHLLRLALDPAVAPTLLGGLAPVPHPVVPDLLFDLAQRGEPGSRTALLADDLLLGVARGRASPALAIALDVRAARSCERVSALIPRIAELADDRVAALLERVDVRTGCGPKRTDDCWSCLRGGEAEEALAEARRAARERRFVAPWSAEARRAAVRAPAARGGDQRGSAQQRKPVE